MCVYLPSNAISFDGMERKHKKRENGIEYIKRFNDQKVETKQSPLSFLERLKRPKENFPTPNLND